MLRFLCVVLCAAVLAGCATSYRIPATDETVRSIQSTKAFVLLNQEEIVADFIPARGNASAGVAGVPGIGLLAVLVVASVEATVVSSINAERAKEAEAQAAPVRDALLDYKFRDQFQSALRRELSDVSWLKLTEIKHESPVTKTDQLRQGLNENGLLLLNTRYSLSPGLKELRIWCVAALLPNDDHLKGIASRDRPNDDIPRLYRNEFTYSYPLPVAHQNAAHAASAWSATNGAATRAALSEGTAEIAKLIAMDMKLTEAAGVTGSSSTPAAKPAPVTYAGITGELVAESTERVALRLDNGTIRSISKNALPETTAASNQ